MLAENLTIERKIITWRNAQRTYASGRSGADRTHDAPLPRIVDALEESYGSSMSELGKLNVLMTAPLGGEGGETMPQMRSARP